MEGWHALGPAGSESKAVNAALFLSGTDMNRSRNALPSLLFAVVLTLSCSLVDGQTSTPVLQGFDLVNEGVGEVRDVEIRYGAYVLPPGGASSIIRVSKIKGLGFHQAATVPIPDVADIHWKTADGRTHDVSVPIRGLLSNMDEFHGFKFMFEDERIELAATYLRKPPQPYGTYYVLVYSSPSHADGVGTDMGGVLVERPKP